MHHAGESGGEDEEGLVIIRWDGGVGGDQFGEGGLEHASHAG